MPRVFVRMESASARESAAAFMGSELGGAAVRTSRTDDRLLITELSETEIAAVRDTGAEVFDDVRFHHFEPQENPFEVRPEGARYWEQPAPDAVLEGVAVQIGLPDVLEHIRAPQAWEATRGEGVTIAVIDTGTCGTMDEFPAARRSPIDLQSIFRGLHWEDERGHGSMCACIAAASSEHPNARFDGVAPGATLLSARSTLWASDVFDIYDELVDLKRSGDIDGPLVVSNSYGLYVCSPPATLPENHPYLGIVREAVNDGIVVVFAAGNNHVSVCHHDAGACEPNSIWAVNSDNSVITVGTVNRDETNLDPGTIHKDSSRGPGQWAEPPEIKPNCAAPTYGEVMWGCGYQVMEWWGTSGACPQVAGLAALMLSKNPSLTPAEVKEAIQATCKPLAAYSSHPNPCVGHGMIDCKAAVDAV